MKSANTEEHIKSLLKSIPEEPGVYQYYDASGTLLYVGKAKNLKKRVTSYFTKDSSLSGKTTVLVRKTVDIKTIVVATEYDALLLENSLIKQYQPRYNILLKDDKTYPWICIKNEDFPRVFPTRTVVQDGSQYFGPFASVRNMNNLLDLVRQLYPLRTCKYFLSPHNIRQNKFKACLEYSIGNCKAPCEGKQPKEEYDEMIRNVRDLIKGNLGAVARGLKEEMLACADRFEFEAAQALKEKLTLLEKYQAKSAVVSPSVGDVDVFSILEDPRLAYVNFMKVIHGCVVQSVTVEISKKLEETSTEILLMAIAEFRERGLSEARELVMPVAPEWEIPGTLVTIAQRGDKKKLLDLSLRNAFYYRAEREKQKELIDPERHVNRIMERMMTDLRLKEAPLYIECFDNSNTQGGDAVSAMVVFRKGKPAKSEYRHFNIRTVEGPDDYASMQEVITRRYKRLVEEGKPLPHLVIVDGGKGQLSAAVESIKSLGLYGKLGLIGIAKRLEEIYYPNDPLPLYLDKKSETLKVIQQMRDEAHRFGITHHRKKREQRTIRTELVDIKGIGSATAQLLLHQFKSVKNIEKAQLDDLSAVIGKAKAQIVFTHFHPDQA